MCQAPGACILSHGPLSQWKGVPDQSHSLGSQSRVFWFFFPLLMRENSHIWLEIWNWDCGGKEHEAEDGFQSKSPASVLCPELKPEPRRA